MAKRWIKIELDDIKDEADYADLANAVWMMLRVLPHNSWVHLDDQADPTEVDERWEGYGTEARWSGQP